MRCRCAPARLSLRARARSARLRTSRDAGEAAGRERRGGSGSRATRATTWAERCSRPGIPARAAGVEPRAMAESTNHRKRSRDLEGRHSGLASGAALDSAGRRHGRVRSGHQRAVHPDAHPARQADDALGDAGISLQLGIAHRSRSHDVAQRSHAWMLPSTSSIQARPAGTSKCSPTRKHCGSPRAAAVCPSTSRPIAAPDQEYARLYQRFAELIAAGASDVDLTPLQLVADAFARPPPLAPRSISKRPG